MADTIFVEPFAVKEGIAFVRYRIVSGKPGTYDVRFILRRKNDASFKIKPREISGAVGPGQPAGVELEAKWDFSKDVGYQLSGDDFYFQLTASLTTDQGGWQWWHYALGGGVIAGGVVAWLILKKDGENPPPPAQTLPDPPKFRPNQ